MRVLMIAPEPFFSPRGTPISIYFRLQALSRLGIEIDLLTYHLGDDVHFPGVRIFRTAAIPFVRKVKVGPSYIKPFLDLLVWVKALAMLAGGRYDLIHAHEEAAYFALPLARMFGVKLLYDMHSSLPQQLANYGFANYGPLVDLFSRLERSVLRRAGAVITICPDLDRHVESLGAGEKSFLIENFAVAELPADYQRSADRLKERYDLEGKLVITYTGTFERNQGLDLLVRGSSRVVAEFPQAVYLMVGGRADQLESLRAMAVEEGVGEHFLFTGPQPFEDIPVFLWISDLLVSPRSHGTNTPLKIYSYLASGRPIVATDMQTHRQVLTDETAMLVPPNAEGLSEGIRRLLGDAALRERIGQGGRHAAGESFSYQSYLSRIQEVFDYLNGRETEGVPVPDRSSVR